MEEHKHRYDEMGRQLCCNQSEKIYDNAGAASMVRTNKNAQVTGCCSHDVIKNSEVDDHDGHDHSHDTTDGNYLKLFMPSILSLVLLLIALGVDNYFRRNGSRAG